LISETIVKKLGLITKPHKKPYPLGWIHNDNQLQVNRQCVLKFAINSQFIDEVELDVVPLDICGIVLGSPYLYDRKEIFYREDNKYQLATKGCDQVPSRKGAYRGPGLPESSVPSSGLSNLR
jgi:hypothetical protein